MIFPEVRDHMQKSAHFQNNGSKELWLGVTDALQINILIANSSPDCKTELKIIRRSEANLTINSTC